MLLLIKVAVCLIVSTRTRSPGHSYTLT